MKNNICNKCGYVMLPLHKEIPINGENTSGINYITHEYVNKYRCPNCGNIYIMPEGLIISDK